MNQFEDLKNEISSYEWEDDLAKIICGSLINLNELIEEVSEEDLDIRLSRINSFEMFKCFFEPLIYYKYKHNIYPNRSFETEDEEFITSYPLYDNSNINSLSELFIYGKTPKVSIKELFDFVLSILYIGRFNVSSFVISIINIKNLLEKSKLPICQHNWRPIFITSLILSDKLWDDKCAKTGDLAKVVGFISPQVLTHLELVFSVILDWNFTFKLEEIKKHTSNITKCKLDNFLVERVINSEFYQSYCCEDIYEPCNKEYVIKKMENKNLTNNLYDLNNKIINNKPFPLRLSYAKRSDSPSFFNMQNQQIRNSVVQNPLSKSSSFFGGVSTYQQNEKFLNKTTNVNINRAMYLPHSNSLQKAFFSPISNNVNQVLSNYDFRNNPNNLTSPKSVIPMFLNKNPQVSKQPISINHLSNSRRISLTKNESVINDSKFKILEHSRLINDNIQVSQRMDHVLNSISSVDEKSERNIVQQSASRMSSNPHIFEKKIVQSRASSIKRSSSEHSRVNSQNEQSQLGRSNLFSYARNTVSSAFTSITRTFGFNSNKNGNSSISSSIQSFQKESSKKPNELTLFNQNIRNISVPPNSNPINNQINNKFTRALSTERSSSNYRNNLNSINNLSDLNQGFINNSNIRNLGNENLNPSIMRNNSQFSRLPLQAMNQNLHQMQKLRFSQPVSSISSIKFSSEQNNKSQFDQKILNYPKRNSCIAPNNDLNSQNYKFINNNLNLSNRSRFQNPTSKSSENYLSSIINNKAGSQFSISDFINPISKLIKGKNSSIPANDLFNSRFKHSLGKII